MNKQTKEELKEEPDLYRDLCNKLGKCKVWNLNPDEVCEEIEKLLLEKVKK